MKEYSFTVVITTYNRPDYLLESLKGALSQTVKPKEVLVIDDFSSEDYQPVLEQFDRNSFQYIKLKAPSGANVARNTGVELATGDVIAFLDDDDVWDEDYLEQHLAALQTADAVTCGFRFLENPEKTRINPIVGITQEVIKNGNKFCGMSGVTCKAELAKKLKFDVELKNSQDWDFFVRITLEGAKFVNIPKPIYNYRRGHVSISTEVKNMPIEKVYPRLKAFKKHRAFLGSHAYSERVSEQVLSFIGDKSNKWQWINISVKEAGLVATWNALVMRRLLPKLMGKGKASA
ncbi:glycosyltransferase [Paraglaciecola agarilytica]|uniref:glycosyltransferase family 2 protein n=1 Tax=Paraglaciecola chathamensis TaxID=368405 RepID=UPI001C0A4A6A|nr:glycosyltransferase family 2 protein [Paraglaciecola agarilytica]MBU3019323.1 glycosyltransferase [Paraglaciecola agarilytica]